MKSMTQIQKTVKELVKDFSIKLKDYAKDLKLYVQPENTESNFQKLTKFSIRKVLYAI